MKKQTQSWRLLILMLALASLIISAQSATARSVTLAPVVEGSIAGMVFFDANGNGLQDAGEGGLNGATLMADAGLGAPLVATSDPQGAFTFALLPPGVYVVTVTPPPGDAIPSTAASQTVTVDGGPVVDIDFGLVLPIVIKGTIFDDLDSSGTQEMLEPGIPDVAVSIFRDANANGQIDSIEESMLLGANATDFQGNYLIPNMLPGYVVMRLQPPGINSGGVAPRPLILVSNIVGANTLEINAPLVIGSATVGGEVYFDGDGDGVRDADEGGLVGVTITARDAATNGATVTMQALTGANGAYAFTTLPDGAYTITESDLPQHISTTPNTISVVASAATPVGGVRFGDAAPITMSGMVFDDLNQDGGADLNEPGVPDVLVEVFVDANGNSILDAGETHLLGSAITDEQGNYLIPDVVPGKRVVRITPPAGIAAANEEVPIGLISYQVGGNTVELNFHAAPVAGYNGVIYGVTFNDADGNEQLGVGEALLGNVRLTLYVDANSNRQRDPSEAALKSVISHPASGAYLFDRLGPAAYVIEVDPATLPGGWVSSFDASAVAFDLGANVSYPLDLGFYDALLAAPMRLSEWKREFKQVKPAFYTLPELNAFASRAAASSRVFDEVIILQDALIKSANTPAERARKEFAALWLNVASSRLLPKTPVNLPELTSARSVEAVVASLETLLQTNTWSDRAYQNAEKLASALNNGKGLGYGIANKMSVTNATLKGKTVTSNVRSEGDGDAGVLTDQPLRLLTWNTGSVSSSINALNPQISVLIKRFDNGAVVELRQVRPDGVEVVLGRAVPTVWNKDIRATYTFPMRNISTVAQLANVEIRAYVIDPDNDDGAAETAKIDMAQILFIY